MFGRFEKITGARILFGNGNKSARFELIEDSRMEKAHLT